MTAGGQQQQQQGTHKETRAGQVMAVNVQAWAAACKQANAHARLCRVVCASLVRVTHSSCFTSPAVAVECCAPLSWWSTAHTHWPLGGEVKHGECAALQRMTLAAPVAKASCPPTPCTLLQAYWTHTNRQPGTRQLDPNTQHTKQQQRKQQRVRHLSNEQLLGGHSNQYAVLRPPWRDDQHAAGGRTTPNGHASTTAHTTATATATATAHLRQDVT